MAKKVITISLATKFRVYFATAVLGIIAAALVVPWFFMEILAQQGMQRPGAELTRLRLNEFILDHPKKKSPSSRVAEVYTAGDTTENRSGPVLIKLSRDLKADRKLDSYLRDALRAFTKNTAQDLAVFQTEDKRGRPVYRCIRAVRVTNNCMSCHNPQAPVFRQFQQGELVGMIDVSIPGSLAGGWLIWWTRAAFVVGVVLAGIVASIVFALIAQRLILRPIRHLRTITDKAADGDLDVRSRISSGDELQRLGEDFNQMLGAIAEQHRKLHSANEALDLKLSEMSETNVALYKANQVKSEFLANISHELRTPLNSIIGFADLLSAAGEDKAKRYGQNIAASAKNLLAMINDLLDLAKIDAGKADVRFDKVSVTDTCSTLKALMQPLADKKQIKLELKLDEGLPIIVTDGGKLQQILFNFLSNAIKFTPNEGIVTFSAWPVKTSKQNEQEGVVISVGDTGPGIPEAEQQNIFEKFYRAEAALTKESAGTGLGLAIAKELTGLLGGKLRLNSSPGHGAEFSITLPVDPLAENQ